MSRMIITTAEQLLRFAIHDGGLRGDIDPARKPVNRELARSIRRDGVREAVTLEIDTARSLARIGDGNHRVTLAAAIDPLTLIPVKVKRRHDYKRAPGGAVAYHGEFERPVFESRPDAFAAGCAAMREARKPGWLTVAAGASVAFWAAVAVLVF